MTELWPCTRCGAAGFRNLGVDGYCATHLAELYRRFRPETFALRGIGLPERHRPDFGAELYDLRCVACDAGWVGPMFDPCGWCADAHAYMLADRARSVLQPPDVDPNDRTFHNRMAGWAQRLVVAVDAELITVAQADRAWRGAHRKVAA